MFLFVFFMWSLMIFGRFFEFCFRSLYDLHRFLQDVAHCLKDSLLCRFIAVPGLSARNLEPKRKPLDGDG